MSMHNRCEEMLRQCEKLLRDADVDLGTGNTTREQKLTLHRRRNAINAACNALHRAVKA
jgi:hypothetical protein